MGGFIGGFKNGRNSTAYKTKFLLSQVFCPSQVCNGIDSFMCSAGKGSHKPDDTELLENLTR